MALNVGVGAWQRRVKVAELGAREAARADARARRAAALAGGDGAAPAAAAPAATATGIAAGFRSRHAGRLHTGLALAVGGAGASLGTS